MQICITIRCDYTEKADTRTQRQVCLFSCRSAFLLLRIPLRYPLSIYLFFPCFYSPSSRDWRPSLSLSLSLSSCSQFGSPPTFHINLLLPPQSPLQAVLIHTALYSRMKYLCCVCYYFLCHAIYTSKASETEASPPPPPLSFAENVNTVVVTTDHVKVKVWQESFFETVMQIQFVLGRYNNLPPHV